MCIFVYVHMCICVGVHQRSVCRDLSKVQVAGSHLTSCLRQGLFVHYCVGWLTSFWHFSCVYIPSPYRCTQKCIMNLDITVSCFYMSSGDLNSDCQVCMRKALPIEPYPWPPYFNNFLKNFVILQVSLSCILIFFFSISMTCCSNNDLRSFRKTKGIQHFCQNLYFGMFIFIEKNKDP